MLWRLSGWQLRRDWVWLLIGAGTGLLIALWAVIEPFDLRHQRELVFNQAQLLAAWGFAWSLIYACAQWLSPKATKAEGEDLALPISRLQQQLNQAVPQSLVPLLTGVASLVWFSVVLIYVGVPYDAGYSYGRDLSTAALWWLRISGAAGNIMAGPLLAFAWGQALEALCAWRPLRVILALGVPVGLVLLLRQTDYEFFYICYRQTRGYEPYVFIIIPLALLLLPGLLAWLWRPWQQVVVSLLLVLATLLVVLPFVQYQLPGEHTTVMIRDLLGDWRYGLGYFAGHLNIWQNVDFLDYMFLSNVLLDDNTAGNLIPRHVPLWWGAVLYPLLLPALVLASLGSGKLLRPARFREK